MRVLLDTNVLVSLLGPHGEALRTIEEFWDSGRLEVCLSEDILLEFEETVRNPRLVAFHHRSKIEVASFVKRLRHKAQIEDVPFEREFPELRDPDDMAILEAAKHLKVELIVTGDKDLLVLKEFEGIPIVSPRQFVQLY